MHQLLENLVCILRRASVSNSSAVQIVLAGSLRLSSRRYITLTTNMFASPGLARGQMVKKKIPVR